MPADTHKTPLSVLWNNPRLQVIVLAAVCLVLYITVIRYEYIGIDDTSLIVDNYPFIKDLSNIPKAFTQDVFKIHGDLDKLRDYYRPLLTVSFMLEAKIAGNSGPPAYHPTPPVFHFSNILLHFIAVWLLFLLLGKTGASPPAAFFPSLLFAVHPMLNQAVAWIPGRNDTLAAIFVLAGTISFMQYMETRARKPLLLHLLFLALGLFTKENSLMLVPVAGYFYAVIFRQKLFTKQALSLAIPYACIIAVWYLLRAQALAGSSSDNTVTTMLANIWHNFPLLIQYIGKTVFPVKLSVLSTLKDTQYFWGILACAAVAVLLYTTRRRSRQYLALGAAWYFIFLAPSLSATLFEGLEHRVYLPMAGFMLLLSRTDLFALTGSYRKFGVWIIAAYIALLAYISHKRIPVFKNRFDFYKSAMETSPHSVLACLNLGKHHEEMGQYYQGIGRLREASAAFREAIAAYRKGLERDSSFNMLHNNIGGAYLYLQQHAEAEREFLAELRHHPQNAFAHYNMGLVRKMQGRTEEAVPYWQKTLELNNNFIYAYQQLAEYSLAKGDTAVFRMYQMELKKRGY